MAILYPDEITYDYLRALYTPYRTALPDPTVLPLEDDIMWNEFIGGPNVAVIDAGLVVHGRPPSASAWSRPGTPGSAAVVLPRLCLRPGGASP